jgi:magnesium transporter
VTAVPLVRRPVLAARCCGNGVLVSEASAQPVYDGTASHYVSRAVPVVRPTERAGDVRRVLTGRRFDCVDDIAVCEGTRLLGLIRIEDVLAAPSEATAASLMDADPPVVAPGTDQEHAAWKAVRHGESSLAVVDAEQRFVGLIPPHRMLGVLLWEHDEDMARLGGFLRRTEAARSASEEPVLRRYWHRLPWLLLGLGGSLVAGAIVRLFEEDLLRHVLLAAFLPGIVYMADAVGTQTETLVIRGLSLGVPIARVLARELVTGVLVGVTVAAAFLGVATVLWNDAAVVMAVTLALLAACSAATVVGIALPYVFDRFGWDPAFGSGPVATVVQDVLSIALYFAIAAAVMR